jgi:hypothetical protein
VFNLNDPEALWLNVVNIALGVVVVVCVAVLAVAVMKELVLRYRQRAALSAELDADMRALDDHAFPLPELGLTMADGGERLDKTKKAR